jgi:hypothetical protein
MDLEEKNWFKRRVLRVGVKTRVGGFAADDNRHRFVLPLRVAAGRSLAYMVGRVCLEF